MNLVRLLTGRPPRFDARSIGNARFMWCLRTGELILGGRSGSHSSHGAEHGDSGARGRFDEFVSGWVGWGGAYRNGVVHFAPHIPVSVQPEHYRVMCSTLAVFASNGATERTVLRGASTEAWEVRFGDAYPELLVSALHWFAGETPVRTSLVALGSMATSPEGE